MIPLRLAYGVTRPAKPAARNHAAFSSSAGMNQRIRYSWPSDLDLMARLARLRLDARWSNWEGRPFTAENERHISVYKLPSE